MAAHVLVVDDDEVFANAVSRMLAPDGYRTSLAHHFGKALEILEGPDAPDLLFVDLVMPGSVNGIALASMARIRHRRIRIIYTTGYDIPRLWDEPMYGPMLRKPFPQEELLATVKNELAALDE